MCAQPTGVGPTPCVCPAYSVGHTPCVCLAYSVGPIPCVCPAYTMPPSDAGTHSAAVQLIGPQALSSGLFVLITEVVQDSDVQLSSLPQGWLARTSTSPALMRRWENQPCINHLLLVPSVHGLPSTPSHQPQCQPLTHGQPQGSALGKTWINILRRLNMTWISPQMEKEKASQG